MDQVVSRRPLTAEAWTRSQSNAHEICGGQSGSGTVFLPELRFSPDRFIPSMLQIYRHLQVFLTRSTNRAEPGKRQVPHRN